jgi:transposase
VRQIQPFSCEDFIFLDESGLYLNMQRSIGRALKGYRAFDSKKGNQREHFSYVAALSLDGVMASMTVDGSTDTNVFMSFLSEMLIPKLDKPKILIMDNLSVHKVKKVQELVTDHNHQLIYLPPYSPYLNPIELFFSKIKGHLKNLTTKTRELLEIGLNEAINKVCFSDIKNWFSHCGYVVKPK